MSEVYPPLKKYWSQLKLEAGSTVLVPLCGKSLDIDWLIDRGHNVVGVDVASRALRIVMERHSKKFTKSTKGAFTCYRASNLELWEGDFLKLRRNCLPEINAVYDKAALIALPPEQRKKYVKVLLSLLSTDSPIFLNTFEYAQDEMSGPPFSVPSKEIQQHFGKRFAIHLMQEESLFEELARFQQRGLSSYLTEKIYYLQPH